MRNENKIEKIQQIPFLFVQKLIPDIFHGSTNNDDLFSWRLLNQMETKNNLTYADHVRTFKKICADWISEVGFEKFLSLKANFNSNNESAQSVSEKNMSELNTICLWILQNKDKLFYNSEKLKLPNKKY
jgi:hypothetical protein